MVERTIAVCSQCGIKFEMAKPNYLKNLKEGKPIMCPECRKKERSKKMAERMANMSEDEKKAMYKKASTNSKKFFDKMKKENPEAFEARMNRVNVGAQKWRENETEEERRRISEIHSESNRRRWENMTASEKETYKQNARDRWINKTEEEKNAHRQHSIDMWANKTLSQFNNTIAKMSSNMKSRWNGFTPEEYREYIEKITKGTTKSALSIRFGEEIVNIIPSTLYIEEEHPTFNYQNNTKYSHSWDYAILNSQNEIELLIDLDGAYFHGDDCDYDFIKTREDADINRVLSIPDNTKCTIVYEKSFEKSLEWIQKILPLSFDQWSELMLAYYQNMPFPYPSYQDTEIIQSFNNLLDLYILDVPSIHNAIHTRIGDRIIQHFHHSIWHTSKDGHMAPYNAWHNKDIMKNMISHHLFIHNYLNKNKIAQGFMVSDIVPRVPVFSAARAKALMLNYMPSIHEVFDPYPEFSGRMLAAIANKCKYVVYENDQTLYNERQNMLSFLNNNRIETDVTFTTQGSESFQCMFTSVSNMKNQDQIIDDLISRYKCQQYVLIASDIEKYMNYVKEVIYNISPCDPPIEYIIIIYSNDSIK